jgi:LuxR family transcriptional regulator, maltose regulon positive regulatory protein
VGRHRSLAEFIEVLPVSVRSADPWLGYWWGVARTGSDPAASRAALERSVDAFARAGERKGQVRALAALLGGWWNEPDNLLWLEPLSARLGALLDEDDGLDASSHATGLVALALARLMIRPADPALARWAERLATLSRGDLPPALLLSAGTCLLQFHWGVGDAEACDAVVRRTRALAERADMPPGSRMWFRFWLMTHQVYRADAVAARAAMQQARAIQDEARRAPPFIDYLRWDVTLELQQGHIGDARERLTRELEPQLPQASRFTQASIELEWVRCANEEGRYAEAIERGQRALRLCQDAGHDWLRVVVGLSVCCAQALSGRLNEGFATLAELRLLSAQALPLLAASIEAYAALLHLRAGATGAAREALDRAMALRGHSSYAWGPGWNRPAIAELAAFALGEGRHAAAMTRFVHALRLAPPSIDVDHWPWPVRVRVLDGFAVEVHGAAQPLQRRKSAHRLMQLLQALAAFGGANVPAQSLCDAVWSDADGDAAMRSLDTSLSRLRRLLGSEAALQMRGGKVTLHPSLVHLDLALFSLRSSALVADDIDTPGWAARVRRALQVYRRPLLIDEGDAPWLVAQRERWRQRWLDLVGRLSAHLSASGDVAALHAVLDDALQVEAAPAGGSATVTELMRLRRQHLPGP